MSDSKYFAALDDLIKFLEGLLTSKPNIKKSGGEIKHKSMSSQEMGG